MVAVVVNRSYPTTLGRSLPMSPQMTTAGAYGFSCSASDRRVGSSPWNRAVVKCNLATGIVRPTESKPRPPEANLPINSLIIVEPDY